MIRSKNACPVCGGIHWLALNCWFVVDVCGTSLDVAQRTCAVVDMKGMERAQMGIAPISIRGDLCLTCGVVVS